MDESFLPSLEIQEDLNILEAPTEPIPVHEIKRVDLTEPPVNVPRPKRDTSDIFVGKPTNGRPPPVVSSNTEFIKVEKTVKPEEPKAEPKEEPKPEKKEELKEEPKVETKVEDKKSKTTCEFCGRKFTTLSRLGSHLQNTCTMRMVKETCTFCGKIKMTSAKSFATHERNCQKKMGIKKEAVHPSTKETAEMEAMHQDRVSKLKEKKQGEYINPMKQFHRTLPSEEAQITEVDYRTTDFEKFKDHMEKYEEYKKRKAEIAREKYEKKQAEDRLIKMKLEKERRESEKKKKEVIKTVVKDTNPYSGMFDW